MPATTDKTDAQIKNDARPQMAAYSDRKKARDEFGPTLRSKAAKVSEALQAFGSILRSTRDNWFTVAECKPGKAFDKYLAEWTGLKRSTADGYIRVAEILGDVESADDRKLVQTFPLDSIKGFGAIKTAEGQEKYLATVKEKLAKGETVGTKEHEKLRDSIKPRQPRNTPGGAEKTAALVATLRPKVAEFVAGQPTVMLALIAGAQWQMDNPKDNLAEALTHIANNPIAPDETPDAS